MRTVQTFLVSSLLLTTPILTQASAGSIEIHKDFEGASLGNVEVIGEGHFRCHVEGQQNELGRNRQASWFMFRLDHVKTKPLTICMTDFVGEYNGKPACPMSEKLRPVYSYDGEHWRHFDQLAWDETKKEATLHLTPEQDTVYLAQIPPYTQTRLLRLLDELAPRPTLLTEVIGKSVQGRDLLALTVTNSNVGDSGKKYVWLQSRQHAWEAGTSWVMEGALRFITSDDPAAVSLRDKVVFKFTPMVDPDGCVNGKVRFNTHGYDVNRHWDEVDLRDKTQLQRSPEIWYTKKAIVAVQKATPIALMVNMHNTETSEYLETLADEESATAPLVRLFKSLKTDSLFDPSRLPTFGIAAGGSANDLWASHRVPVALMELRIGPSAKLEGRCPTVEDRLKFGAQLIQKMGEAALEP